MTPIEKILARTPEQMNLLDVREDIEPLRHGIRRLVKSCVPLNVVMREVKRQYIEEAVARAEGNQSKAAFMIEAHRNTVSRHVGRRYKKQAASVTTAEQNFEREA